MYYYSGMKISFSQNINPSFKSATICINALSDTHGELLLANSAVEEMRKRKKDIFTHEKKGSANIIAVCGDWFMDGAKTGYLSAPQKPLANFQLAILNGFYNQLKKMAIHTKTLFSLGNHDFDGGVPLLDEVLSHINADVIATNLDIENSEGFIKSIHGKKLINEKIVEVEDDKNPNLKHKLLFLGIMPVNLQMYQKELDGVSLVDLNDKPLAMINEDDYRQTLEVCKNKISDFKKENPNAVVVVLCHTGADFADNLVRESDVDLVFDGHEHKTKTRIVNKTPIIPLSQNFQKIANARIKINDEGKVDVIRLMEFNPSENTKKGPIYRLYRKLLGKDIEKQYSIKTDNPDVTLLDIKGIREGNNFLANFVTDSILTELKKKDSDIDIFALNASAIRHSLEVSDKPSISSFDVLNVLAGIKEEDGQIMTTEITGSQLVMLVVDNILFNNNKPQKNPIIHYSGLIIDRQKILNAVQNKKSYEEIAQYIIDTNTSEPVEIDKIYKIANVEKYFNKSQTPAIKALKEKSNYVGYSVQELFRQHFNDERSNLAARCDIRIK